MPQITKSTIFKRLLRDARGTTSVVMALSIIPITGALGISVDMARIHSTKSRLQAAVDSAALAASINYKANKNATLAADVATQTFNVALGSTVAALATPEIDTSTGKVTLTASARSQNYFISLLAPGQSSTIINATAEVKASSPAQSGLGMNLEVALMLDVTISMSQNSGTPNKTKLQAMQEAAKSLIGTVVQSDQSKFKSRVALVPFSSGVNVGTYFRSINGSNPNRSWTSVVERAGAYAFTEDAPSAVAYFPALRTMKNSAQGPYASFVKDLSSNTPSSSKVVPLSSDTSALNTAIDAYSANGTTAGHLGIAFSWYALSPNWSAIWGTANAGAAYDEKKTLKVAVLMSDFDFNSYYQTANGNSAQQAAQLCANMKSAGVTVYTIGFQVDTNNTTANNLFTNCATSTETKLTASNGEQMIAAFNTIAQTVLDKASGTGRIYVSR